MPGVRVGAGVSIDAIARLMQIRSQVESEGRVTVRQLAVELGVSEMTIRRDLDALADEGALRRVRGGGLALGPQPFADRFGRHARAKERIAAKLADLFGEGGAVGMDASSTLQRLAGSLDGARDVTVVTNGPESFNTLQGRPGVTPMLTGGELDPRTGSLVGPLTSRAIREFSFRRLFLSAAGIDPELGTTEVTIDEAEAKLAFAAVSAHVVVALDSSKLGHLEPARCLSFDRIDILVTELEPDDLLLRPYRKLVQLR
ncbi:MAG: DeoR/GlpR family DNA-binding transcription regulator [Acidimicrobiales bacterium]